MPSSNAPDTEKNKIESGKSKELEKRKPKRAITFLNVTLLLQMSSWNDGKRETERKVEEAEPIPLGGGD